MTERVLPVHDGARVGPRASGLGRHVAARLAAWLPWSHLLPWVAAHTAAALVFLWARTLDGGYLAAAAIALAAAPVLARRGRSARAPARSALLGVPGWGSAALLCLAAAMVAGAATERRLAQVATGWDRLVTEREARLTHELQRTMELVVDRGARAAVQAAALPLEAGERLLFSQLSELRSRSGAAALAIFDGQGELVAWAGEHRGPLPEALHAGTGAMYYAERPLFSYLYFSAPIEESPGWRAVSAVLIQTGLPVDGEPASLADRFAARTGTRPFFAPGDGTGAAWRLAHDGEPVVHGRFEPLSQAEWRATLARTGARVVTLLGAAAMALLGIAWLRAGRWHRRRASAVPLGAAAVVLPLAPLGTVLGLERFFSPALFMVPLPRELTLGTLLAVLLPLAALAATRRAPPLARARMPVALAVGAMAVALGFAGGLRLMVAAAAPPLLQSGAHLWVALFPAAALLLTLIAGLALPTLHPAAGRPVRVRPVPLVAGLVVSAIFALTAGARWQMTLSAPAWMPALWAAPFALLAVGLADYRGRAGLLARWLVAGWLAGSVVIPHLWAAQMEERFRAAERELATLGARPDPYLDYLLRHFALEAGQRAARGEAGEELLYRSWIASNMAREGYPASIVLWGPGGERLEELSLGGGESRLVSPAWYLDPILARARSTGQPVVEATHNVPNVNQILAVPLTDGRVVSVVVPPRRSLDRATVLAPFLGTGQGVDRHLTLVPRPAVDAEAVPGEIRWRPIETGWRSEALVQYPEGEYHAHLELRTPPLGVRLARAVLLLAAGLGGLALLWLAGRAARGHPPAPLGGWSDWLRGFRARVTMALFAFFLLPTALFGWVAYRALAGEVTRAARMVAERAVNQAVTAFPDQERDLRILAGRIGEEVLLYHRGEMIAASSPEAMALGLYDAWMPPSVYLTFRSGEEIAVVDTRELVRHPYLVAYRGLPAAGTLAVPVSLRTGDAAVRQSELAHLVLFAALIGGLLSLALSVAVGRALAEPIGQLRRAAAAVGAGRLGVRLPEARADEFGELFASFNRMVRRLRRARARELHTARVLAWGEMARQIAHEIKNPLTPIKLSVQHLRRARRDRRPDFDEILESNVEQVLAEIDRLSDVARAFSRYGSPAGPAGPLQAVDVGAVVSEVLALYRAGETDIRFSGAVGEGLPPARARAGELKEVMLNLIENARAAVDGSGKVVVSASADAETVDLIVGDDGHGIPPELLPRIFEPHFSTRTAGTGLGLAIVRKLVESWGGHVDVESRPGRGTTVRVRMQRAGDV